MIFNFKTISIAMGQVEEFIDNLIWISQVFYFYVLTDLFFY